LSASGAAGFLWLPGYTEAPSITVSPVSSITYSLVGSNGTCIKTTTVTVNVGVCDGIETYDNSFIRFYPNPVKDLIHIELPQNMTAVTARMFDATGRLVKSVVLNGAEKTISVEKLERGIYQVQVLNGATVLSSKFIKE
jgi:hypothetical protein